jgi:DNA-directed RNA polymerase specialized sigma24 family protein
VDGGLYLNDAETRKDDLERVINDHDVRRALVERYEKMIFGFILSFAPFSREQAFEIAVSSFTRTFRQMWRVPRDDVFLEGLFRRVLQEFENVIPGGDAGLSAFGDFPPNKKGHLTIVREGLIHLSREDKAALLLRDQCHLSFERIAGILGTHPRQAKSACLAARERLRRAVQAVLEKKTG